MAIPITFEMESPGWLRNLRWAAIFGMTAAVAGASFLGAHFPLGIIYGLVGALALWNLFLPLVENRFFATSKGFVFLQILVDLSILTAILWFTGGLVNPFVTFFVLHVMIAGLMLNPVFTMAVSFFAIACVMLLTRAPDLLVGDASLHLQNSPIWYGIPVGLILLIFFTNAFILIFLNRLGTAQGQQRHRVKMDALGRLVAGLAHEIGTPLNSILVLSKNLEESVPDEHKKELSIIASQAKRCGEIVSLLLGYSQTFVRRGEDVKYTPVNLRQWIEAMYDLLLQGEAQRFPNRARPIVDFKLELKDLPETVHVPELILRQVLENLFKNARDALAKVPHPKITVRAYQDYNEDELVFEVEDNGPGFSKEEQERAFEAFFSTKQVGLGTGLGLYISYYLLSQVGGRIVIEEHSGPGAKMLIALPQLEGLSERTE
jgi:two-component system sensor histidine kinase RegB